MHRVALDERPVGSEHGDAVRVRLGHPQAAVDPGRDAARVRRRTRQGVEGDRPVRRDGPHLVIRLAQLGEPDPPVRPGRVPRGQVLIAVRWGGDGESLDLLSMVGDPVDRPRCLAARHAQLLDRPQLPVGSGGHADAKAGAGVQLIVDDVAVAGETGYVVLDVGAGARVHPPDLAVGRDRDAGGPGVHARRIVLVDQRAVGVHRAGLVVDVLGEPQVAVSPCHDVIGELAVADGELGDGAVRGDLPDGVRVGVGEPQVPVRAGRDAPRAGVETRDEEVRDVTRLRRCPAAPGGRRGGECAAHEPEGGEQGTQGQSQTSVPT